MPQYLEKDLKNNVMFLLRAYATITRFWVEVCAISKKHAITLLLRMKLIIIDPHITCFCFFFISEIIQQFSVKLEKRLYFVWEENTVRDFQARQLYYFRKYIYCSRNLISNPILHPNRALHTWIIKGLLF